MKDLFEPTGHEVDLSDYDFPPTPAPTAGEILQDNPEAFSPQYPDPTGIQGGDEDE